MSAEQVRECMSEYDVDNGTYLESPLCLAVVELGSC
jgi:hypothetical protein